MNHIINIGLSMAGSPARSGPPSFWVEVEKEDVSGVSENKWVSDCLSSWTLVTFWVWTILVANKRGVICLG